MRQESHSFLIDRVRQFFCSKGYDCTAEYNLKELLGIPIKVDLICRKKDGITIVEGKTGEITSAAVAQIAYLRTFPPLSNANLYLAIPKLTRFSKELWAFLTQTSVRVIRIGEKPNDIVISIPHLYPSVRLDTRLNLQKISAFITQRSIPPSLLLKLQFSNIGYANELNKFVDDYEVVKNPEQENDIILSCLENLWLRKYGKRVCVSAFSNFNDFEPLLRSIPRYRDHFVHPFQVFLLGSLVIDQKRDLFANAFRQKIPEIEQDTPEFTWLLASTFHDITYPVQMFKKFTSKFFSDFLQSEQVEVSVDFKNFLIDNQTANFVDQLVSLYDFCASGGQREQWRFNSPCLINGELRECLLKNLVDKQNHGILSALALLKKVKQENFANDMEYIRGRFSTDVFPAALAIALHDLLTQQEFSEIAQIKFSDFPFGILLIYLDTVQEWGRSGPESMSARFLDFQITATEVSTTLALKTRQEFEKKMNELDLVFPRLASSEIEFSCKIICEENGLEYEKSIPQN